MTNRIPRKSIEVAVNGLSGSYLNTYKHTVSIPLLYWGAIPILIIPEHYNRTGNNEYIDFVKITEWTHNDCFNGGPAQTQGLLKQFGLVVTNDITDPDFIISRIKQRLQAFGDPTGFAPSDEKIFTGEPFQGNPFNLETISLAC